MKYIIAFTVSDIVDVFLGPFIDLFNLIVCTYREGLCWLESWMIIVIGFFSNLVLDALPDLSAVDVASFVQWVQIINSWIPLDFIVAMSLSLMAFFAVFATFKFLIRMIPFVG